MDQGKLNAIVRAASPADLDRVGDIFAWYTLNSVATFEEAPRTGADWSCSPQS